MRANGMVEMDSYRLAAYTVPCPCYICGGGNNFDAELCRHCHAPMALSHQATSQKIHPRMIAAIGPSGAGKTVYLGMLTDMLSRRTRRCSSSARGAFSIKLQQHTMSALSRCEFPSKTPNEPDRWHWVHCQVLRKRKKPVELIMPDLAGEALLEEVDHPNTYPVIHSFLGKCSSVLILVDAPRAEAGESDEGFHTMKLISYLCELALNIKWPGKTARWPWSLPRPTSASTASKIRPSSPSATRRASCSNAASGSSVISFLPSASRGRSASATNRTVASTFRSASSRAESLNRSSGCWIDSK